MVPRRVNGAPDVESLRVRHAVVAAEFRRQMELCVHLAERSATLLSRISRSSGSAPRNGAARTGPSVPVEVTAIQAESSGDSDLAADAIFVQGDTGELCDVNAAVERLLGRPRQDILGRRFLDFVSEERDKMAIRAMLMAPRSAVPLHAVHLDRPDGSTVTVELTTWFLRQTDHIRLWIARASKAENAIEQEPAESPDDEGVGDLTREVAHDFNNLLGVINAYAELLIGSTHDETQLRDATEIRNAATRAGALARQLLYTGRGRAFAPTVVDLNEVVRDMVGTLEPVLGAGITIATKLKPMLGRIVADRDQLHQVLLNLAVNARDAMPDGGALMIETADAVVGHSRDSGPGPQKRHVVLRVSDTGTGMSAETQARIFEPFFTTKEQGKGSGLGLATVRSIVGQHGGFLRLSSEIGRGSTFYVYFPSQDADDSSIAPRPVDRPQDAAKH
jgi:two-component system, cell cycle sensor histidine kinase and response regulator CckA